MHCCVGAPRVAGAHNLHIVVPHHPSTHDPLLQLDVITRVAGGTLLVLLAICQRDRLVGSRWFLIPLVLCLCGWLAGNSPDPALRLRGPLAYPAVVAAGYTAVFLWWFCLAVFDAHFRPRGPELALGIAWILFASADRRLFGDAWGELGLSRVLVVMGLYMVGHLAWRLVKDREDDLYEGRRRFRHLTVAALGGQLFLDVGADVIMGFDWQPQLFSLLQNTVLLIFVSWLVVMLPAQATRSPVEMLLGASNPGPSDPPELTRLVHLMEVDRLYLNPELTFERLVHAVGASERTVRRLINQELGHEHFRTFLNVYRVAEAGRLLRDPARRGDKLLAIALASGFSSLPTFNRVFKLIEGMPPSVARAQGLVCVKHPPAEQSTMRSPAGAAVRAFKSNSAGL